MPYSIYRMLVLASVLPLAERVREEMQQLFDEHRLLMEQTVLTFVLGEITPETTFDFERQIATQVREGAFWFCRSNWPGKRPSNRR